MLFKARSKSQNGHSTNSGLRRRSLRPRTVRRKYLLECDLW